MKTDTRFNDYQVAMMNIGYVMATGGKIDKIPVDENEYEALLNRWNIDMSNHCKDICCDFADRINMPIAKHFTGSDDVILSTMVYCARIGFMHASLRGPISFDDFPMDRNAIVTFIKDEFAIPADRKSVVVVWEEIKQRLRNFESSEDAYERAMKGI